MAVADGVSMEFRSTTLPDYVRIEVSGDFSLEQILPMAERFFQAAVDARREAMLLDMRAVTGREPTMAERYRWAVHVAELQSRYKPLIRVALVGHEPLIHPERFGEIVAIQHGAVVRVFTEEALALEWLLAKSRAT
jgi:SpoIIAA-like